MVVFNWTYEELNALHKRIFELTESYFFKDNDGEVSIDALGGDYCFGVEKFVKKFPEIDISGYKQIEYVPEEIDHNPIQYDDDE